MAKILENMELGHNIMHGQWDWMRDPKIHSTTWEWDHACASEGWKKSHNFEHHTYTNVLGKDRDLGYSIMRISADQEWHPAHLLQPVYNQLLAAFFEWGVAFYDLEFDLVKDGNKSKAAFKADAAAPLAQGPPPAGEGLRAVPGAVRSSGPLRGAAPPRAWSLTLVRNFWAHAVIFCGHFPEGVATFPEEQLEGETRGQWYVRQMLGSANLSGGPLLHIMTGNLSHQIEHHIFPDIPSNRYAGDRAAGAGDLRRYGLPLHHRPAAQAVPRRCSARSPGTRCRAAPSRPPRWRRPRVSCRRSRSAPTPTPQPVRLAG